MYKRIICLLCSIAMISCVAEQTTQNTPVKFSDVNLTDAFWSPRLELLSEVTVPFCLDQCMNQTSRLDNFAVTAGLQEGEFKGLFYDDSDLYKMLEGASYSLKIRPDAQLESQLDSIIDILAQAQTDEGYLNTWFQLAKPGQAWTDMDKHEMYCCGHLIEAAIAFKDATGKDSLMDIAVKFADYLAANFGEGRRHWVPGHPEIELALIKLYRETGKKEYLELSHFLMEERGRGNGDWKANDYYIDVVPVSQLEQIGGHAVRAMYLFTGMADYTAMTGDRTYVPALDRLWDDVVNRKMYVTGGIGSSRKNEGFTVPYDLPNAEAYCETCASVGMVMWNQRMNMLKGDACYTDVLERSMYNGAIAGISLSSDRFFYVNPLASDGKHHRRPWYGTACCPSQISRFMPSVGGYVYSVSEDCLWVQLYVASNTVMNVGGVPVHVEQGGNYPWEGNVSVTLSPERPSRFALKLRLPGWCKSFSISVNGEEADYAVDKGYALIERKWSEGDKVELNMDMPVEVVAADPRVKANEGRRAIMRGPLVYCIEEVDNPEFDKALLSGDTSFETKWEENLLGGVMTITAVTDGKTLKYIPYYAWDNREAGKMEVWVKYDQGGLKPLAYSELPLGAITPEGWLREMLERQRNGMSSQMDVLYPQVMGERNGWLGGDGDQWERGPYWIDGLLPLAYILDDEALKAKVQPWIEWALGSQREDGFFGPSTDYAPEKGLQRNNSHDWWPRMVVLKILQQHYNATGDPRIIGFMKNYFRYQLKTLETVPLGNWTFWAEYRACDNLNAVLWLYDRISEPWLLDLAAILHDQSHDYVRMFLESDDLKHFSTIHCVNLAQGLKEPMVWWRVDPQDRYYKAVKQGLKDIRDYNGMPNGMYGGDEALHGNNPTQGSELCSAVELMYSLEEMVKIYGDLDFVDHLERIAYNALPTQISDDFMTRQYFQQANQVKITKSLHNFDINHGNTDLVFGLLTGYPCCTSNLHQGWPKFTQNLWYSTPDGGLAALAYAPSKLETEISGTKVTVAEETFYPMDGNIRFAFSVEKGSVRFPMHLRIPSWTKDAVVKVNGVVHASAPEAGKVYVINRAWKDGDVVTLELPMTVSVQNWYENAVSVERGPLVYALKIGEQWERKEFEEGSIYGKDYYEVYPTTPWNYGLMDFNDPETAFEVKIDRDKLKEDWYWNLESAPIEIKAAAKRIPSWTLYNEMAGPLPYSKIIYGPDTKDVHVEKITLVPYGCTTLRISEFPVIKE